MKLVIVTPPGPCDPSLCTREARIRAALEAADKRFLMDGAKEFVESPGAFVQCGQCGFTLHDGDACGSCEDHAVTVWVASLGDSSRARGATTASPTVRDYYLSGPMTGYPEFNYPAFAAATARLRDAGSTVWNPAENFAGRTDMQYCDYIRKDVAQVMLARVVAVLPGWEKSKGAALEVHLARVLGLPVVDAQTLALLSGEPSVPPSDSIQRP